VYVGDHGDFHALNLRQSAGFATAAFPLFFTVGGVRIVA
jgi:hypothetical protein